ncbi:hypothetical protein B879_02735 [Cecembia lonarensis LW9]|uniref:HTH cro/C1-type domain-containing protein n=2 Tax=Cecembia TaxID=1187078 RepID=K1LWU1_CECL9|nr:hypothetical protein B879_02735 [Cecembia lonarensis LW9]
MAQIVNMKTVKINLTIEKGEDHKFWGSLTYNENLITDYADSISELEDKIKVLLKDFEGLEPEEVEFVRHYDVYALFRRYDYLKISSVAKYAGMNAALLRQYASGVKNPSIEQAKKIEQTLHKLAVELGEASVV